MNTTSITATQSPGHVPEASVAAPRRGDQRLFQLLFWLSFPVFLLLTAAARWLPAGEGVRAAARTSVISEAAEAACSTIAIVLNV
jgi:hypothetical protein